jgi:signal transduction histidine kinase/FixJ family two-component response regulator
MTIKLRCLCISIAAVLLTLAVCPVRTYAEGSEVQTVKVGYYENEVFEEGASPDAVKNGYAYEYYRKLSEYTGWNYEYVYGGFSELYDMLLTGDIDLLAGLAKRDDRIDIIGYPVDPMGNESYSLVKHDEDITITSSLSSLSGKKIGVLKSAIADVLDEFLVSHSIEANVTQYDDYESLFDAFDSEEIEVLAAEGDGAYGREHAEVICTFGSSDYYMCVSIARPDLLEELDAAQSQLLLEEPNYVGNLKSKYYPYSVSSHAFSAAEREWLDQNSELSIGYLNNYLPYSATDENGNVTGIIKDIIPRMFAELSVPGINVKYTGYDNYDDMIADIRDEKIDAGFPVGGGLYYSEENGIYQSSSVVSASTDLVFNGKYSEGDISTFAVNENNRMQYYYVRNQFPDAQIVYYPDIDACLMAVLKDDVGATTLNGLRANEILKNSRYRGLHLQQLSQTDDRCFGVKIGDEGLLKLLNRGIKVLGPEYSREIAYEYANRLYTYTISDMIRDNLWLFLMLTLLIVVIIMVFIIRDLRRTRLADHLKTDFVSNMSHEIRTPITAIIGMNEMIQRESTDAKILQYSDNIEKAGESLIGIINDILDFSKIEAGRMELDVHEYSLKELLCDLHLMISTRAEEKGLKLQFEVDETLPATLTGDMQKIRQVITNLLTNAVKYTEEGEVRLTVKMLYQGEKECTMEYAVTDTGIGIKADEMDKLYSAFDRLDMERTRNIEGSGLGLAITQRLLSLMGSEVKVESEYEKGSRFFFSIRQRFDDSTPIGAVNIDKMCDGGASGHKGPSFTAPDAAIMIVDDTPMNLQVICGLLKGNGLSIDTAESGERCISMFGANTYDMVFLDQRMPNMDGLETLHELQRRYPEKLKHTPIVCLTANVLSGAKEQMLSEGFSDYLTKPVKLADMEEMMLKYIPASKIHEVSGVESKDEADCPEAVRSIEALDTDSGIEYCGDVEEYMEALKIYRASITDRSGKMEELYRISDYENLSLTFHSVKSTSRAIGALKLAKQAEALEKAAKEEDRAFIDAGINDFIIGYRKLGDELDPALQMGEEAECKETE